ncbi:hypothetical protein [Escherichia coli]|nr:hypothetical protein [Escherichia coli]TNK12770.1 hypothetical protein CI673_017250 [Escherichia coli]
MLQGLSLRLKGLQKNKSVKFQQDESGYILFNYVLLFYIYFMDKLRSGINSRRKAEKTPLNAAFWIVCCFLPDAA